jgi:hypothetical protein
MLAVGGEIWIDVSWEESTVIVAFPLTEPNCALMIALPPEIAITLPLLTLATVDADEVQVTKYVITRVLPSLKVPVATQFTEVVGASMAVAGVMEIEVIVAEVTFSGVEPETPVKVAVMLAVPGPTTVARPPSIVATAGLSDVQVESRLMS